MVPATIADDLRKRFLKDLAVARAAAAADAEAFDGVVATIEGIGGRLSGIEHGLHRFKDFLRAFVRAEDADEFNRLFEVVRDARNHAVHTGAAARHLTT